VTRRITLLRLQPSFDFAGDALRHIGRLGPGLEALGFDAEQHILIGQQGLGTPAPIGLFFEIHLTGNAIDPMWSFLPRLAVLRVDQLTFEILNQRAVVCHSTNHNNGSSVVNNRHSIHIVVEHRLRRLVVVAPRRIIGPTITSRLMFIHQEIEPGISKPLGHFEQNPAVFIGAPLAPPDTKKEKGVKPQLRSRSN
jgi:hypothetical protein